MTFTSSPQKDARVEQPGVPVEILAQLAAQICTHYPVANVYFAQALGHRLHFLAGAGEETYLPAVKIHVFCDIYLFCEPREELMSDVCTRLIEEVRPVVQLWWENEGEVLDTR